MGYLHIENLYKAPDLLMFREVYALEKIHGTSAHISWKDGEVKLFSGGEKPEKFAALFDLKALAERLTAIGNTSMIVYGEAYGGKCQGMSETYGKSLKFVVFDVKVGECWLSVPKAEDVAKALGLEFVFYEKTSTDLPDLNRCRDANSTQAVRNGITDPKPREGVVLRPLEEFTKNNGGRVIAKHKREEFMETATVREIDPTKLKILEDAKAIADEWVTPMRLTHVLDKVQATEMNQTGDIIRAMLEDVKREAGTEVVWSKDAEQAVCRAAAALYKRRISEIKVAE